MEEATEIATFYNIKYYETSALEDKNVSELFMDLAKAIKSYKGLYKNDRIEIVPIA